MSMSRWKRWQPAPALAAPDHLLRQMDAVVDLSWIYKNLSPFYFGCSSWQHLLYAMGPSALHKAFRR
jgi:hypothetical protein